MHVRVRPLLTGPCWSSRADKERKYAELVNGDRCRLVVVAVEIGGRCSDEVVTLLDHLASHLRVL